MLLIVGTIRLPPEKIGVALDAMEAVVTASRAEKGCLEYGYAADLFDEGLVHIKERWSDRKALAAHGKAKHIKAWRATWPDLGIGERSLQLFEVGEAEAI